MEQHFWDALFASAKLWGLYTYEQDWLYNEFLGLNLTMEHVDVAERWLLQLGSAALNNGVYLQLCMAYPRHALQSVSMLTASQVR